MKAAIGTMALAAIAATTACSGGVPCDVELTSSYDMPDLDMLVGDTVETPLADHFGPHDCVEVLPDPWELRSSDPSAVAVSVSAEHVLTTAALAVADSVLVRVATPYFSHEDFHEFVVRVRPAGR